MSAQEQQIAAGVLTKSFGTTKGHFADLQSNVLCLVEPGATTQDKRCAVDAIPVALEGIRQGLDSIETAIKAYRMAWDL